MIDLLGLGSRCNLGGPLGLAVEHDGDLGLDRLGAHQTLVGQTSQIGAQLAHITEDLRILARMLGTIPGARTSPRRPWTVATGNSRWRRRP